MISESIYRKGAEPLRMDGLLIIYYKVSLWRGNSPEVFPASLRLLFPYFYCLVAIAAKLLFMAAE